MCGKSGNFLPRSLVKINMIKCLTAAAKSLQSCLTLSDSMDCSLPGSSVHGIFQAKVLEWGAIAFSKVFDDSCQIDKSAQ